MLLTIYSCAQPFADFNNEFVWIHLLAGKTISRPASCPAAVFESLLMPCFAVVPTERIPFADLQIKFEALVVSETMDVAAQTEDGKISQGFSYLNYFLFYFIFANFPWFCREKSCFAQFSTTQQVE